MLSFFKKPKLDIISIHDQDNGTYNVKLIEKDTMKTYHKLLTCKQICKILAQNKRPFPIF